MCKDLESSSFRAEYIAAPAATKLNTRPRKIYASFLLFGIRFQISRQEGCSAFSGATGSSLTLFAKAFSRAVFIDNRYCRSRVFEILATNLSTTDSYFPFGTCPRDPHLGQGPDTMRQSTNSTVAFSPSIKREGNTAPHIGLSHIAGSRSVGLFIYSTNVLANRRTLFVRPCWATC